jgi:hypothetical protein
MGFGATDVTKDFLREVLENSFFIDFHKFSSKTGPRISKEQCNVRLQTTGS